MSLEAKVCVLLLSLTVTMPHSQMTEAAVGGASFSLCNGCQQSSDRPRLHMLFNGFKFRQLSEHYI